MHDPHVVNLFVNSVHIQDETEVGDGSSHVDHTGLITTAAELDTNEPTLTEGEFVVQRVLCLTSVEWSWVNSELEQLFAVVLEDGVTQSLQLGLNIALPLQELISLLRKDVDLDEMAELSEESQSLEEISPTQCPLTLDLLESKCLFFSHLILLVLLLSSNFIYREVDVLIR